MVAYIIVLYAIISLFFLFDTKFLISLTELKAMNYLEFITLFISLSFLSLAGIPPLLGFCIKFILFIIFMANYSINLLVFFVLFNFFAMFFYLQNLRFLISKEKKNYFLIKNNIVYWDKNVTNIAVILNYINILGILVIDDLVIIFNNGFSYSF